MLLALVLTVISLVPQINVMKAQYDSMMESIQKLGNVAGSVDVEKLQDAIEFVGSIDYSKMTELNDMLDTMDAAQLKTQLEQISSLLGELDELNTEALVDNINLIIEKLEPIMNWLR